MKQRGILLIGIVLIAVYYFLFPRHSGLEPVLQPVSFTDYATAPRLASGESEELIPVCVDGNAAFLDEKYNLARYAEFDGIVAGSNWMAWPGEKSVVVAELDGSLRFRLQGQARPVSVKDHLYLYNSNAGQLEMVNPQSGVRLWLRESLSPLTALDAAGGKTLLGFLDGHVELISPEGKMEMCYEPGGSRIEAVYGAAIRKDAAAIALVSGLHPQRFVLLEEKKNGFRPVMHHDTGTGFRRRVPVGFVSDGSRVLYESASGTAAVNPEDGSVKILPVAGGAAFTWADSSGLDFLVLLGNSRDGPGIRILTSRDRTFFQGSVPPDIRNVLMSHKALILAGRHSVGVLALENL